MTVPKNSTDKNLKIRIAIRIERPQTLKFCGYLWTLGKFAWKKWKKRYFCLVRFSLSTHQNCPFHRCKSLSMRSPCAPTKSAVVHLRNLSAQTVSPSITCPSQIKSSPPSAVSPSSWRARRAMRSRSLPMTRTKGNVYSLRRTVEEKQIYRHGWVQALYRATGQAYKPVPPRKDAAPVVNGCK